MNQKSQKQKQVSETILLFQRSSDLLFFKYDTNHPKRIDIEEFYIGKFRLFIREKVYSAELKSKPFLNPLLIWNAETFELMFKKLDDFVIQQEVIDLSEWIFLSVYIKVKGKQINLLKIRLTQQFGIDLRSQLWDEFRRYNLFRSKYFSQAHRTIQVLNERIQFSLDRLEKTQKQQNSKVDEIKRKLSALMYQKQKKIMELTGNHLYQWNHEQTNKQKVQNNEIEKNLDQAFWMSSQDERVLVGSLFAPSQDFLI